MKILVIEDEQHAAAKLMDFIKEIEPKADIDLTRSVEESIRILKQHSYDLIFSDIELLDGQSFEIYQNVEITIPIIFTTAYNTFYTEAFESNGIGYLLKPYDKTQFETVYEKYKTLFKRETQAHFLNRMLSNGNPFKQTFTAKHLGQTYLLQVQDISYIKAQGDFVIAITTDGKSHSLNFKLAEIYTLIDPDVFYQINRSEIINFNQIETITADVKNKLAIKLQSPNVTLTTSNSRSSAFRKWIDQH